jgi:hypothetical protein
MCWIYCGVFFEIAVSVVVVSYVKDGTLEFCCVVFATPVDVIEFNIYLLFNILLIYSHVVNHTDPVWPTTILYFILYIKCFSALYRELTMTPHWVETCCLMIVIRQFNSCVLTVINTNIFMIHSGMDRLNFNMKF